MNATMSFTLRSNFNTFDAHLNNAIHEALKKSATIVTGEVKRVLTGRRSGRIYRVPATRRTYTASAPYEPPAVRLGALRQSYDWDIDGHGVRAVAIVGTRLRYALMLEKGTSRMAPRPHLSVAFQNKKSEIERLFGGLL